MVGVPHPWNSGTRRDNNSDVCNQTKTHDRGAINVVVREIEDDLEDEPTDTRDSTARVDSSQVLLRPLAKNTCRHLKILT